MLQPYLILVACSASTAGCTVCPRRGKARCLHAVASVALSWHQDLETCRHRIFCAMLTELLQHLMLDGVFALRAVPLVVVGVNDCIGNCVPV